MAIGSGGEIGKKFGRWGDMSPHDQQEWWEYMRTHWGDNLMAGYATTKYANREDAENKQEDK